MEISSLDVCFGERTVVHDLSLTLDEGTIAVLLGPNGAGKTTTIETLLGFRRPTKGSVSIFGHEPVREHAAVVARTGALLQNGGVWFPMSPREVLVLTASYYPEPRSPEELIDALELSQCAKTPWRRLSGGERQRTLLALALLGRPDLLVLDEPTSAVDPEGHRAVRQLLRAEKDRGCALLITTHQLADAELLGDQLTILDEGRVVAAGTLGELSGAPVVLVESSAPLDTAALSGRLGCAVMTLGVNQYRCDVANSADVVSLLNTFLAESGAELVSLRTRASLEETYFALLAKSRSDAQP